MSLSIFDLFSIGIGPSSSHTVGPMRAASMLVQALADDGLLGATAKVEAELFGSLGATGHGHGTPKAVLLGLEGHRPESVDPGAAGERLAEIRTTGRLWLLGRHPIVFNEDAHLTPHRRRSLPYHSNGMRFHALGRDGATLSERTYYSVGGGFVVDESAAGADRIKPDDTPLRYPFTTAAQLLQHASDTGLSISGVMMENEKAWRTEAEVQAGLLGIWKVMQECIDAGCASEGLLPGGLKVRRRAAAMRRSLEQGEDSDDTLRAMDWVALYALAVNEENAAGGREDRAARGRRPPRLRGRLVHVLCLLYGFRRVARLGWFRR